MLKQLDSFGTGADGSDSRADPTGGAARQVLADVISRPAR